MKWIALVYAVFSLLAFGFYGFDKRRARLGGRRIPENWLHGLELCGGWPGAWLAQLAFRHKTQKTSFRIVFWAIVVLHVGLWAWWAYTKLSA